MTRLHTTGCNGQPGTCTLTLAGRIGTTKFSREKRRDRSVHQRQNEPSTNPSPKIRIPALRSSKLLWDEGYLVLAAVLGSLNELSFKTPFSVRRKSCRNSVGGASKEGKSIRLSGLDLTWGRLATAGKREKSGWLTAFIVLYVEI